MKKAIIFDLYGTLVKVTKKTNPYLYLLSTAKNEAIPHRKIIHDIITDDYETDELILFNDLSMDDSEKEVFNNLLKTEIDSVIPINGVYRAITKLVEKDYRLFLLSNLSVPYMDPFYSLQFDSYFEKAFFSCKEHDRKPNASFYQKVLNYARLEKEDVVMIGDSLFSDIEGAKKFGIDAIYRDPEDSLTEVIKELL
jgi:FMN phosphatase YigB (HAD superfamily)